MVNHQGKSKTIRVFLNASSQAHFITEDVANFLNLIKKPANIYVTGIDNTSTTEHFRLKHAGMQATLYSVRQNYWPLNGRSVTRSVYFLTTIYWSKDISIELLILKTQ
ncbi:Protein of unknown function, partial [Cotesia congregata]